MKKPVLFIWICLGSLILHAEKYNGSIKFIDSNAYQLEYQNQTINVYFKYPPAIGHQKSVEASDLTDAEQYEIVEILKDQIDQLPAGFIDKYLKVDIFPLHILNHHEFGFYTDHKIGVEVNKIKNGMSFKTSIKSSFMHELAHKIEHNPTNKKETTAFKEYLKALYRANPKHNINMNSAVYQNGYVSGYASGELIDGYNVGVEFAELFAHLLCEESRQELMSFLDSHPETVLADKINRFVDYLEENVPSLNREYIFGVAEEPDTSPGSKLEIDEDLLLNSHELRSYESFDFNVPEDRKEQFNTNRDLDLDNNDHWSIEYEKPIPESNYSRYPYSDTSDSISQCEPDQKQRNKSPKMKKRKKRKGTGLLIAGTALYIALQLMK